MTKSADKIDWQGHRGCRGLVPENTIPAFIHALSYPIQTLELDVVVSKDKQIIVSHEPWFSAAITTLPDGTPLTKEREADFLIYQMDYAAIQQMDCGSRGNEKFPEQRKMKVSKPSFKEMVKAVEAHCIQSRRPLPSYNIELKSQPDYYDIKVPAPQQFVQLMLAEIADLGIRNRINLQSFDINILNEVHRQDSSIIQAYLIENLHSFEKNLSKLDFTPAIYSPYFKLITPKMVKKVHSKDMKLIPWTVNEIKEMQKLLTLGVDGIITDYPNKIEAIR